MPLRPSTVAPDEKCIKLISLDFPACTLFILLEGWWWRWVQCPDGWVFLSPRHPLSFFPCYSCPLCVYSFRIIAKSTRAERNTFSLHSTPPNLFFAFVDNEYHALLIKPYASLRI